MGSMGLWKFRGTHLGISPRLEGQSGQQSKSSISIQLQNISTKQPHSQINCSLGHKTVRYLLILVSSVNVRVNYYYCTRWVSYVTFGFKSDHLNEFCMKITVFEQNTIQQSEPAPISTFDDRSIERS